MLRFGVFVLFLAFAVAESECPLELGEVAVVASEGAIQVLEFNSLGLCQRIFTGELDGLLETNLPTQEVSTVFFFFSWICFFAHFHFAGA